MKRALVLLVAIVISVAINTQLVDNRDYPEDAHELYIFGEHVAQVYMQHMAVEIVFTGK